MLQILSRVPQGPPRGRLEEANARTYFLLLGAYFILKFENRAICAIASV